MRVCVCVCVCACVRACVCVCDCVNDPQAWRPWAPHFLGNILITQGNSEAFKFHHVIHESTNFGPQLKIPSDVYSGRACVHV